MSSFHTVQCIHKFAFSDKCTIPLHSKIQVFFVFIHRRIQSQVQSPVSFANPAGSLPPSLCADMELGIFSRSSKEWLQKQEQGATFYIPDPQCDFTPHTVLLNRLTEQSAEAKSHSCIHSDIYFYLPMHLQYTFLQSAHTCAQCYNLQTLIQSSCTLLQ